MAEGRDRKKYKWKETKEGVEHFLLGKYLQSSEWNSSKYPINDKYEYIPDSKVLVDRPNVQSFKVHPDVQKNYKEKKLELEQGNFRVKTLVHATTPEAAANILVNGFQPNEKFLGKYCPEGNNDHKHK